MEMGSRRVWGTRGQKGQQVGVPGVWSALEGNALQTHKGTATTSTEGGKKRVRIRDEGRGKSKREGGREMKERREKEGKD